MEGNSSEQEEDEEEGGRGGGDGARQLVPETPDQEAFLKEHFVTLADLTSSGMTQRRHRAQDLNLVLWRPGCGGSCRLTGGVNCVLTGSPSRTSHSSNESLSISSRFLSQNSSGR